MSNEISTLETGCGSGCACGGVQAGETVLMDRRRFVSVGALAAAAAALAACAGGLSSSITAPSSVSLSLQLTDYPALANIGGVALVTASGSPVAVVRASAASFVALSRICPHQGGTIGTASGGFYCPNHGAEFNLSGAWTGGQRTSNMRSYATSYNAATGTITVG